MNFLRQNTAKWLAMGFNHLSSWVEIALTPILRGRRTAISLSQRSVFLLTIASMIFTVPTKMSM